jgi:hypothetical protein
MAMNMPIPDLCFFTLTFLRALYILVSVVDYNSRALQGKNVFVFSSTVVMQLASKNRWLQLFIHPFFSSSRSRVQTPKEDHPPHTLPKWLQ